MFENTGGQYFLPVKYCTVEFSMGGPEPSAEVPSATVDDKKKQRLWGDQAAWNSDKGMVAPVEGPLGWCRLAASGLPRLGQKNEAIPLAAVFASNISPTAVGCPTISTPL